MMEKCRMTKVIRYDIRKVQQLVHTDGQNRVLIFSKAAFRAGKVPDPVAVFTRTAEFQATSVIHKILLQFSIMIQSPV